MTAPALPWTPPSAARSRARYFILMTVAAAVVPGGGAALYLVYGLIKAWGAQRGLLGGWWPLADAVLASLIVTGFIAVFGLFAIWMERKVSAHMQCRVGPMEVGWWHGWLQTLADGLKLLAKEDLVPRISDRLLFALAPIIAFTGIFLVFVVVPFAPGPHGVVSRLNVGVFYFAAMMSVEALGVIMAGWSSNNKWALFGTIRLATQLVCYEIPLGLSLLTAVVIAGSLDTQTIIAAQSGWLWNWFLLRNPAMPVAFLCFFIATLAECKRAPFDLPEAESELVAGYHTEYSGMRFSIFFLAEYSAMFVVAALAAILFLGGYWTGIAPLDRAILGAPLLANGAPSPVGIVGTALAAAVLVTKALAIVFVQMWLRWTLPRIRLDQVLYVCFKVLLPFALGAFLLCALWQLLWPGRVWWF